MEVEEATGRKEGLSALREYESGTRRRWPSSESDEKCSASLMTEIIESIGATAYLSCDRTAGLAGAYTEEMLGMSSSPPNEFEGPRKPVIGCANTGMDFIRFILASGDRLRGTGDAPRSGRSGDGNLALALAASTPFCGEDSVRGLGGGPLFAITALGVATFRT
jgi:hypothetical protein